MIAKAKERLGERATYLVADLAELEVGEPVDLIFSTATFHWIADHDRLFAHLHGALKPGGRLVAQCGGQGNVAEHAQVIATVAARPEFASHLEQMTGMWNFAAPRRRKSRLRSAGFADGALLARAEAGHPGRPARLHLHRHPRPAPGAAARRAAAAPSPKRSSKRRHSR